MGPSGNFQNVQSTAQGVGRYLEELLINQKSYFFQFMQLPTMGKEQWGISVAGRELGVS